MGSAASSSVLHCPKGYDKNKFKQICCLFDTLDKDSNMGVSSDELNNIADLHVQNCISNLNTKLDAEKTCLAQRIKYIHEQKKNDIQKIKDKAEAEQSTTQIQSKAVQAAIKKNIHYYANMTKYQKQNTFMKALTPKDKLHIDFWTFFEYMKNRTEDIQNIKQNTP